ncbi:MAG: 2-oxo acid dehydrogenase subunit E2 [Firmicutes bacterium]|nr:2-oxo acid dehydrogenase subunit E2 [Bacillota bacterium]
MAHIVTMPKLGLTMTEGTITRWLKNVGDPVQKGDLIFEVATDKITNQVEALEEGILRKIIVPEGSTVPVGAAVAILAAADEPLPEIEDETGVEHADAISSTSSTTVITPAETTPPLAPVKDIKASPLAKRLAREHKIDLSLIKPSRSDGRIVEKDVLAYLKAAPETAALEPVPAPEKIRCTPVAEQLAKELGIDLTKLAASSRIDKEDVFSAWLKSQTKEEAATEQREPLVGMRKIIAQRMAESKRIAPHVTYNMEVDMSQAKNLYTIYKTQDHKISYNDIVVLATARALRRFPLVNASLVGEEIVYHNHIHVGVAVALDHGLIVPVVKDADQKSLSALAQEVRDLATRARQNMLSPDEITGGTFTVTNLGMYGIDSFTPVINQPESAILGVCRIADKPVVENSTVVIKPMMNLSLSADHRLVDGALAAEFLSQIKAFLEEPALML